MSTITIDLPDALRQAVASEHGEAGLSRWGLETLVAEAVREGLISGGYAGQILGLSFEDREAFLSQRRVYHDLSEAEMRTQQDAIEKAIRSS